MTKDKLFFVHAILFANEHRDMDFLSRYFAKETDKPEQVKCYLIKAGIFPIKENESTTIAHDLNNGLWKSAYFTSGMRRLSFTTEYF